MQNEIDDLVKRLVRLEDELERKLEAQQEKFQYRIEKQRAVFEENVVRQHRRIKAGVLSFLMHSPLSTLIVAPFVYGLIVPLAVLDISVYLFQLVCFPIWGMARVRRADWVIVDRHRLAYLNGVEKLNCAYCGYGNGVIAYARETASRTEQYWCPIKHALRVRKAPARYRGYIDYGDAGDFRARMEALRADVRKVPEKETGDGG
jgi:hypothetical protein